MPWSFSEWYEQNGSELNDKRRQRYQEDPDYRQTVLERNRVSSKKAREKRREEAGDGGRIKLSRTMRAHLVTVEVDGEPTEIRAFTLGALAAHLGKSRRTLYKWEREGHLPDTPIRSPSGHRLYTIENMDWIKQHLTTLGKVDPSVKVRRRGEQQGTVKIVQWADGRQEKLRLFRLGMLARVLGKTRETLLHWERGELLPETPFRTDKMAHRLYTVPMIEAVKTAFDAAGGLLRGDEVRAQFKAIVAGQWMDVSGASLIDQMSEVGPG